MSIDTETISRRAVLGGVAGLGFAFGAGRLFTGSAVAYTQQAAAGGSGGLLVYWRETVNGGVTESSLPSTGDGSQPTGPVVDLTNAQPGDRGALAVGLALGEDVESSARVWMALVPRGPTPYAENGINEPERKAGDVTPDVGELQEYVHVDVWYDDGFFGLGGCDGEYNSLAETAVASGTFAEVADALADGVPITVPSPVVLEWWRGQHGPAARLLDGMVVEPLSFKLAQVAGGALAKVPKIDRAPSVIDAVVVASAAQRADVVYTGDVEDLQRVSVAAFPSVRILGI